MNCTNMLSVSYHKHSVIAEKMYLLWVLQLQLVRESERYSTGHKNIERRFHTLDTRPIRDLLCSQILDVVRNLFFASDAVGS